MQQAIALTFVQNIKASASHHAVKENLKFFRQLIVNTCDFNLFRLLSSVRRADDGHRGHGRRRHGRLKFIVSDFDPEGPVSAPGSL